MLRPRSLKLDKLKQTTSRLTFLARQNLGLVIAMVLTTLTYSNSIFNGFVSDDLGMLNSGLTVSEKPTLIVNDPNARFSPILYLTYLINYFAAGRQPLLYHLTNLALYLTSTMVIYIFLKRLVKNVCPWMVVIFAIHPAHTEVVAYISARPYLIYSIFFVTTLIFYLSWLRKRTRLDYLLSLLFGSLTIFSSPHAIILPIVIALTELFWGNFKENWKKVALFSTLIAVVAAGVLIKKPVQYRIATEELYSRPPAKSILILSQLAHIPISLATYLNLSFLIEKPSYSQQNITNLFSAIFIAISLLTLLVYLRFRDPSKFKLSLYFLTFTIITLLPSLNPFTLNPNVADRYFFLPSLGLFAAVFLVLDSIRLPIIPNRIWLILLLSLTALLSYQTYQRNFDWKNDKTLFLAAVRTDFHSSYPHFILGDIAKKETKLDEAEFHFRMAAALNPDFFAANLELGKIYILKKDHQQAQTYLDKAIKTKPDDPEAKALSNYLMIRHPNPEYREVKEANE